MLNIPSTTLKHIQETANIDIHLAITITHPKQLDSAHNNNPNNFAIMGKQPIVHSKSSIEIPYKINRNKNKCK